MTKQGKFDVDLKLTEVDYVVSDLHINHKNIIKYCRESQFEFSESGLDDMNWQLFANWNNTVSRGDTVLYLGDFGWFKKATPETRRKVTNLTNILNGELIFIRGDHDHVKPEAVTTWDYSAIVRHKGREYLATHFPGDTPANYPGEGIPPEFKRNLPTNFSERWDGWQIHGHHHNSWLDDYPLINPERRTINCSVELTGYRPLEMDEVHRFMEKNEHIGKIN